MASALSSQPDRRRNRWRAAPTPSIAAAPLSPGAGIGPPRRGASKHRSRLVSLCTHLARTVVPCSQREPPMCHRRETRQHPRFPASEISRHFNGRPTCASRCTGRTSVRDRVTLSDRRLRESVTRAAGDADSTVAALRLPPRTSAACSGQWRENSQELCLQSESEIQATVVGGIGGLHKAGAGS